MQENVEDDDLALLFPELARDGELYQLSLSYSILGDSAFPLRPSFSLRRGAYDGDSSSFVKVVADLSGRYQSGRLTLIPKIVYSYKEHDEEDPIFASTRNEHGYSFGLVANYRELFGIKSLALRGIAGYSRGDANEDFYDTESLFGGLGLVYLFK